VNRRHESLTHLCLDRKAGGEVPVKEPFHEDCRRELPRNAMGGGRRLGWGGSRHHDVLVVEFYRVRAFVAI
jgi:hypothetical protein